MDAEQIALEARDRAVHTAAVVEMHVKECDRRAEVRETRDMERDQNLRAFMNAQAIETRLLHERISKTNDNISKTSDGVKTMTQAVAVFLIMLLLSVIGFLIVNGRPWERERDNTPNPTYQPGDYR